MDAWEQSIANMGDSLSGAGKDAVQYWHIRDQLLAEEEGLKKARKIVEEIKTEGKAEALEKLDKELQVNKEKQEQAFRCR